ncbi:MAG TPA: hypothetical protein VJ790_22720 [Dongiaceae bacterium]|nr:hypothetical protein [Dongiaceae bacterium]
MNGIYVMLAPIQLKDGLGETALIEASDGFQTGFASRQPGILKRLLLRAKDGSYADLVFFASKEAADRVVEAERTSAACHAYFEIMQIPEGVSPDMGVLSFEHVKTYE